jgi:hypothetical protein
MSCYLSSVVGSVVAYFMHDPPTIHTARPLTGFWDLDRLKFIANRFFPCKKAVVKLPNA